MINDTLELIACGNALGDIILVHAKLHPGAHAVDITVKSIHKWNAEIITSNSINTDTVFKSCFLTSSDTSLQWLQYRLIYKILPVKYYLKKIGIINEDFCSFCEDESETIVHLFYECPIIKVLWEQLSNFLKNNSNLFIIFTLKEILFGKNHSLIHTAFNLIILWTKKYIFNCS